MEQERPQLPGLDMPMRFHRRGSRERIVAPDGCEIALERPLPASWEEQRQRSS